MCVSLQADLFAKVAARFQGQTQSLTGLGSTSSKITSDEEASDANQRNRAISSSAITRAMSDANSGTCTCHCTVQYDCVDV